MKLLNNAKKQNGSITLFVLISIMFFIIVLVGLYVNSNYKIQKQQREIQEIQKQYNKDNIDNLYNKTYESIYINDNINTENNL